MDGKTLRGDLRGRGILAKQTYQDLPEGRAGAQSSPAGWEGMEPHRILSWGRFLLKLDFTRKCPDGPRRRFGSLTKVWPSKESLSPNNTAQMKQ